jgi:hypothetical protein
LDIRSAPFAFELYRLGSFAIQVTVSQPHRPCESLMNINRHRTKLDADQAVVTTNPRPRVHILSGEV